MPPRPHWKNQTNRMPTIHEGVHATKASWRLHGKHRRNMQNMDKTKLK
jgi:hypothetical protein